MPDKYILLVSSAVAIFIAFIASTLPIGIANQATVSAYYPTLFTPASFTFGIWSVIYLSWVALGLYGIFGKSWVSKENVYLLAAAQILSSLWLIPSQFLWIGASLMVMISVVYLLAILFFTSRGEKDIFKYTVELFLGWIIIACIANVHLTLVAYSIYFLPLSLILTLISIILGLLINIYFVKKHDSYIPALVCIWALVGIIIGQQEIIIQITAGISLLALVLVSGKNLYKRGEK